MSRITGVMPVAGELAPRPDHLSFAQVAKLSSSFRLACPRQWAYGRLMGLEAPIGAPMLCGSALDRGVMVYLAHRRDGIDTVPATAAAVEQCSRFLAETVWPEPDKAVAYAEIVLAGLYAFIAQHMFATPVTVQQEHGFSIRGSDGEPVRVVGYSDWIEEDGTIVDLKWSGTPRWNREGEWNEAWLREKRDQVALYWVSRCAEARRANAELLPPVVPRGRICVVQMKLGQREPQVRSIDLKFTDEDQARIVAMVREADDIARSGVHPPRPGEACAFCPFVDRCRHDNARLAAPTQALVEAA